MRFLSLLIVMASGSFILSSSTAYATSSLTCYEVDVASAGEKIESLRLSVPRAWSHGQMKDLIVEAHLSRGGPVRSVFECKKKSDVIRCSHRTGAGDFTLRRAKGKMVFESEYLNFAIGPLSGAPVLKPDDEINEDLALFIEAEEDGEGGHPSKMVFEAKVSKCEKTVD